VDDPPGAEPQAGYLSVPALRRLPPCSERACADRAGGRRVAAAACAHAVRRRRPQGGAPAHDRRVAHGLRRVAARTRRAHPRQVLLVSVTTGAWAASQSSAISQASMLRPLLAIVASAAAIIGASAGTTDASSR